ncbi:hypothetical protein [Spirosoma sp.]|uniref:hypothetical protein n=1 Tax=Spirosoma sp. TaxID=1899569 RepID=UPI0026035FE1|nr:hypothetical protein [Spirosoma sp.]MCX6218377.1 hypothetical protein [Spirosoma sp.]
METPDNIAPDIFYWREGKRIVRSEFMHFLFHHKLIVNAAEGGLVLGPSHDDGGIQLIAQLDNEYIWRGEMEGYEYLVNPIGTDKYHQELTNINTSNPPNIFLFEEYEVPKNISILDCRPITIDGMEFTKWIGLTNYNHWIVNKTATQSHLLIINNINVTSWNEPPTSEQDICKSWWQRLVRKISVYLKKLN